MGGDYRRRGLYRSVPGVSQESETTKDALPRSPACLRDAPVRPKRAPEAGNGDPRTLPDRRDDEHLLARDPGMQREVASQMDAILKPVAPSVAPCAPIVPRKSYVSALFSGGPCRI
jgi:hypothetical protein